MHIDLPLHWWKCPPWLFEKMTKLAQEFLFLFVKEKGTTKLLENLSDPMWFQSLWCYLGFDWHSSGLTTVVGGVLSQALRNLNYEVWIYVAGGKWKTALNTPNTITNLAWKYNFSFYNKLIGASKLVARTDSYLLQDGFDIYFHQVYFDKNWNFTIVQQGLNSQNKLARRYHRNHQMYWKLKELLALKENGFLPEDLKIVSDKKLPKVLNLLSPVSENTRKNMLELITYIQTHHQMPQHHWIKPQDFDFPKLVRTLETINEKITNFQQLLQVPNLGKKAIFNLVQTAELIYWEKADWQDPARFSFTHGGKDGTPYKPIPEEFDSSIENLKEIISQAKKRANLQKVYFTTKSTRKKEKVNVRNIKELKLFE